ncbi:hypothetical protein N5K21_26305 [Rhizobium pusense]|uniref:DUF7007 domain-containing protein n=1 Tax=Agrobacterium pusense TaxID=648995 RepID=UPI00244B3A4F|nr:hypothetical protein [Agrobacterium pusense]MDH2092238.1 hypothetical protein [Agrobacterium pusense]
MTTRALHTDPQPTPEDSGVEFGLSAEGFPVARVGDTVLAMLPHRDGGGVLASAWYVARPLDELKRSDFYVYESTLADEAAFRQRVFETVEHKRELRGLSRQTMRVHCSTPWGPSQGATIYAEGIACHTTAGHGGFKLSGDRNRQVNPMLRTSGGWYEEDSEWAIVALTFPHLFTSYERRCADRSIRDWWPEAWERINGRQLAPGESFRKDQRAFEQEHADHWVVVSAIKSSYQPDMTEVVARLGHQRDGHGEERRYLVHSGEYQPGRFGFVIDEARHCRYDGPSDFIGWRTRGTAA